MSTPHNEAHSGDIAKTVLMPGDPLRAQYIAQTYLKDATCFNTVRGMLGNTGTYKGHRVSVMGSGMGMPSIGIYSYELYSMYDVENIIRIGSAGAYIPALDIFDLVLADSAWGESSFAKAQAGVSKDVMEPSQILNDVIQKTAQKLDIPVHLARIHSSDVFYHEADANDVLRKMVDEEGLLCVEMESFALFHNAEVLGRNAACLLTISDSLVTGEELDADTRATALAEMVELALEAAIAV